MAPHLTNTTLALGRGALVPWELRRRSSAGEGKLVGGDARTHGSPGRAGGGSVIGGSVVVGGGGGSEGSGSDGASSASAAPPPPSSPMELMAALAVELVCEVGPQTILRRCAVARQLIAAHCYGHGEPIF